MLRLMASSLLVSVPARPLRSLALLYMPPKPVLRPSVLAKANDDDDQVRKGRVRDRPFPATRLPVLRVTANGTWYSSCTSPAAHAKRRAVNTLSGGAILSKNVRSC